MSREVRYLTRRWTHDLCVKWDGTTGCRCSPRSWNLYACGAARAVVRRVHRLAVVFSADESVTVAAIDRLADLFAVTYIGWWEWAARRDPILARLGLSPDQCGALVALVAGSRKYRHNGKHDSLLAAVREERSAATRSNCRRLSGVASPCSPPPLRKRFRRCPPLVSRRRQGCEL